MGARCMSALGHGQVRECGMCLIHWTQGSVLQHASWCEACTCGCATLWIPTAGLGCILVMVGNNSCVL